MAQTSNLEQLEKDFRSGRNVLAFVPLCNSLRQRGAYSRAITLCREGLNKVPDSTAGRTTLVRLLNDMGEHHKAVEESDGALTSTPNAMGLLVEKARAHLALKDFVEAEKVLGSLNMLNELDPAVRQLNSQWKRAIALGVASKSGEHRLPDLEPSTTGTKAGGDESELSNGEIAAKIAGEMKSVCPVHSCSVIPVGAGEPGLSGSEEMAEVGFSFYRGVGNACRDLDHGTMHSGIIETENSMLFVLVRSSAIVTLATEPGAQFGKYLFRLQLLVDRYLGRITDE